MDFREVCRGAVAAKGAFRAAWVRDAFQSVDRAQFVPRRVWAQVVGQDGLYPVLDRDVDPGAWYRAVWDPHRSVITQMDDHQLPQEPARGDFGLWAPDIDYAHRGDGEERQVQLWDQAGTSVTAVSYGRWFEHGAVTAYGPRDLWPEVVTAYTAWREAGQPDPSRFGITVTEHGQQTWLENPGNVIA